MPDKPIPEKSNSTLEAQIIETESNEIINKLNMSSYKIALDVTGKQYTSEEFAEKINKIQLSNSTISFIIGGSLGLSDEVNNILLKNLLKKLIKFNYLIVPFLLLLVVLWD